MYYKDDLHYNVKIKDLGKITQPTVKGYITTWTGGKTSKGSYTASRFVKWVRNGELFVTIRNSPEGWVVHLFSSSWIYGMAGKGWYYTVDHLKEAEELGNMFLKDELVLDGMKH